MLSAIVSQLFPLRDYLYIVALRISLRLVKQMIIARCRIAAVCGMVQGSLVVKLYAMRIYFLADLRILYEMKHLYFMLGVVAHAS
jgi:hypothetical protein